MKTYDIKQLRAITGKSEATILRYLHGKNKRGVTLPSTLKGRKHIITEKDWKTFIMQLNGFTA